MVVGVNVWAGDRIMENTKISLEYLKWIEMVVSRRVGYRKSKIVKKSYS